MTDHPHVPMLSLDTIWFQVAGTLCNIACTHCFISCSPANHAHEMMTFDDIVPRLAEAKRHGVREYYFTGGEPFMNRDLLRILDATLQQGPATVLTNGMLLRKETCTALRELIDGSEYSLDLRISLDGFNRETHDAVRGAGVWDRVMSGLASLAEVGINPVITVTEAAEGVGSAEGRAHFLDVIRSFGFTKPRLKVLSLFRIGAEESRSHGYESWERLTAADVAGADMSVLQCSTSRMITSKGVYVCPIIIDEQEARMGDAIEETLHAFPLKFGACHTCWVDGVTCKT
jgi:molybdenum cofactor biosynthesis enzyme MoaA